MLMGHKGMCKRWLIKVTLASGNRGPAEDYEWARHFESTMLTLKDKNIYEKTEKYILAKSNNDKLYFFLKWLHTICSLTANILM